MTDIVKMYKDLLDRERNLLTRRGALQIRINKNKNMTSTEKYYYNLERITEELNDVSFSIGEIELLINDLYKCHKEKLGVESA